MRDESVATLETGLQQAAGRRYVPDSLTELGLVAGVELADLSRQALVDQLIAAQRLAAHLDGLRMVTIARLEQIDESERAAAEAAERVRAGGADGARPRRWRSYLREEVGCALVESFPVAAELVHEAARLRRELPDTLAAMLSGDVDYARAHILLRGTLPLDTEQTRAVAERVLPRAGRCTRPEFRRAVHRAVAAVDRRGAAERHRDARTQRRVEIRPADDGMASLAALLPAEDAAAIAARLQAAAELAARVSPDDGRGMGQRRADALVELVCRTTDGEGQVAADTVPAGAWSGRGASVQVVVALSTLLGVDDAPAELTGWGTIPAEVAQRIAADPSSTWRRLVTDPAGRLVDASARTYRPPRSLTEFVTARDRWCRLPGCNVPATGCDLDHREPWGVGGATAPGNLHALSSRCHHLKHESDWSVDVDDDGTTWWTTPTGHRWDKPLDPLPVDTTLDRTAARPRPDDEPPPF